MTSISRNRDHIPELDGVRGIAVLLVLWGHLKVPVLTVNAPQWFHAGVDLFFILSGFLIARILLFNRQQGISLTEFYKRRFARIVPPALLTVAVISIFWPSSWNGLAAVYAINVGSLVSPLDAAVPINHFWSLCVEEQFYLVCPILVLILSSRWGLRLALACCAGCIALTFSGSWMMPLLGLEPEIATTPWVRLQLFTRGWMLILGVVFAYCEPWARRNANWTLGATLGTLAAAFGMYVVSKQFEHTYLPLNSLTNQVAISSVFTFAVWCSLTGSASLFNDRILTFCGRISYGLYLYHFPIYYGVRELGLSPLEFVLVAVGCSFAVALASFHYFEQPIMQWARQRKPEPVDEIQLPMPLNGCDKHTEMVIPSVIPSRRAA